MAFVLGGVIGTTVAQPAPKPISNLMGSFRKGVDRRPLRGRTDSNGSPAEPYVLATVSRDKSDYQPGETAQVTGSGFPPYETVTLHVTHADDTPDGGAGHEPFVVTTDTEGSLTATSYVNPDDSSGSVFPLTAECPDGLHTQILFTDGSQ